MCGGMPASVHSDADGQGVAGRWRGAGEMRAVAVRAVHVSNAQRDRQHLEPLEHHFLLRVPHSCRGPLAWSAHLLLLRRRALLPVPLVLVRLPHFHAPPLRSVSKH